jgi:hypothetical protein
MILFLGEGAGSPARTAHFSSCQSGVDGETIYAKSVAAQLFLCVNRHFYKRRQKCETPGIH